MDHLLLCETCHHAAPGHSGSGCSRCACPHTLETVIELGLEAARKEMRYLWTAVNDQFSSADSRAVE